MRNSDSSVGVLVFSLSLSLLPPSCAACLLHIVQERPKGMFGKLHIHNKVKQVHRVVEVVPV